MVEKIIIYEYKINNIYYIFCFCYFPFLSRNLKKLRRCSSHYKYSTSTSSHQKTDCRDYIMPEPEHFAVVARGLAPVPVKINAVKVSTVDAAMVQYKYK